MFLKRFGGDDTHVPRTTYTSASQQPHSQEVTMFEDSLSEGHLYWGRAIAILMVATTLAFFASQL